MIVLGDSRNDERGVLRRLVELGKGADFLLFLGDIAYTEFSDAEWKRFFKIMHDFGKVIFTVFGNHEKPGFRYSLYLYPLDYSFRIGNYCFFVLNSDSLVNLIRSSFESMLKECKAENKVVVLHRPLFTCGKYERDPWTLMLSNLHKDFLENGVKLVISSHDHNYQRFKKDGITYLVIGGAGAPIYKVKSCPGLAKSFEGNFFVWMDFGEDVHVKVMDINGKTIDSFKIDF